MGLYLFIFCGKIIEISLQTIRVVLITKGEKKIGAFVGFFEVTLFLIVVSGVLNNVSEDPFKILFYALGFAIGNYTGSIIESKIAIGTAQVQIIVKEEHGVALSCYLREQGYGCTVVKAEGKNFPRNIIYVMIPRKKIEEVINKTKGFQSNAVITVNDIRPMYGVYGIGIKK